MSVRVKLMLGIMGIAFMASGAMGSFFYWKARSAMLASIQQELQSAAVVGSHFIRGEDLQKLTSPEDMSTSVYRRIQDLMGDLAQSTPEFIYAYTMRLQGDRVHFVVDSPASDDNGDGRISEEEQPAAIGEPYPNPPPALVQGFGLPSVDPEPWKDAWGWTLSGYAPISTAQGQRVGLLGIDMSANRIRDKLMAVRRAGLISLGLALGLAFALTWGLSRQIIGPVHTLERAVRSVAHGDLSVRLPVTRKDELGRLMTWVNHMIQELREKELLKATLGKVMNPALLGRDLAQELELGGEVVDVTILVCDLHRFTNLSTRLPPHLLVSLLNEYFTLMVREVESRGGMVDKFVGDSIMAVFEHPASGESDPDLAVDAGLAMLAACDGLNAQRRLEGEFVLKNSIGLHSGPVVAGNIGSPERMEYTCIGDAVNVAARLEASTRSLGTRMAVSESFRSRLSRTGHLFQPAQEVRLRGRSQPVQVSILAEDALSG